MKLTHLKIILIVGLFFIGFSFNTDQIYAQETVKSENKDLVRITMNNGSVKTGYILSDDGREVLLESREVGKIYLNKNEIKSIVKIEETEELDKYQPVNAPTSFNTRYHFTTNAFPVKKNENYVAINLYGPEVHFSPINNLSVGVMASWVATPMVLALKYTIPTNNKNVNFGIGTLFGTSGYLNAFENIGGLHWGMLTLGGQDLNVTFSAGISYFDMDGVGKRDVTTLPVVGSYFFPTGTPASIPTEEVPTEILVAPSFSIGFSAKISRTATFIIDGMLFTNTTKNMTRTTDYQYDGSGTTITISGEDKKRQLLYLMPGIRFQSKPGLAFQFSLAGVTIFNNNDVNPNRSFPVPMATWFLRF